MALFFEGPVGLTLMALIFFYLGINFSSSKIICNSGHHEFNPKSLLKKIQYVTLCI